MEVYDLAKIPPREPQESLNFPNIPGMFFGVRHLAIVEVTNMGYTRLPHLRWCSQAGTSENTTPTFTNTLGLFWNYLY